MCTYVHTCVWGWVGWDLLGHITHLWQHLFCDHHLFLLCCFNTFNKVTYALFVTSCHILDNRLISSSENLLRWRKWKQAPCIAYRICLIVQLFTYIHTSSWLRYTSYVRVVVVVLSCCVCCVAWARKWLLQMQFHWLVLCCIWSRRVWILVLWVAS